MPSMVNELLHAELERDFERSGSCLVLSFDKLTVAEVSDLREKFRAAGFGYKVVKNTLAVRAARKTLDVDLAAAFRGKCGVVFAPQELAISAAKLVRDAMKAKKKETPIVVTGGVIEGQAIIGAAAERIADMPDRDTVRSMLAQAIAGPGRMLATAVNAVAGGMARCVQAKIEKS